MMYKKFTNVSLYILSFNFDFVVRIERLAFVYRQSGIRTRGQKVKLKTANIDTQCNVKFCRHTNLLHTFRYNKHIKVRFQIVTSYTCLALWKHAPHKFIIAMINLRSASTKLNKYTVVTMQTYKKLICFLLALPIRKNLAGGEAKIC